MTIALLLSLSLAGQEAESKVREAIATLEKALVAKDESLEDHLDLQALLREMERRGSIPESQFRVRGSRTASASKSQRRLLHAVLAAHRSPFGCGRVDAC